MVFCGKKTKYEGKNPHNEKGIKELDEEWVVIINSYRKIRSIL